MADYVKPLPAPDALTQPFWDAAREGRLLVQRCEACGSHQFYPRPFCLACTAESPLWVDASGLGTLHTFSVVHRSSAPGFADELPYVYAIVDTDEGVRMTGNVVGVDPESVAVGMRVRVTFVEATPELHLPQWTAA